ncbi:hypothetical protein L208DRAFT_1078328, partial [Tricholoma matsutake]
MHLDPSNLMAMRYDLYSAQFDHGTFAIVPKCGELWVHFLQNVDNAANYYHNTLFTNDHVSHQLLFARFAMQIIKFNKSGGARGGERSGHGDSGSNEIDGGGGVGRGNGGGGGSGERDRKELAHDMDLASRTASFFVDETQPIDQWNFDHLTWYPGAASIRRLKEKYLRQNPQVRA